MSGVGAADTTLNPEDYKGFKLAIVAASWHTQVMDGLIDGAQRAARDAGIEPTLVRVPGTFELPVAATRLAEKFDAIVALGVVIRGGDNEQQALDRAGLEGSNEDKGYEATAAALQTAATLKQFSN